MFKENPVLMTESENKTANLSEAAKRALAEAQERRKVAEADAKPQPKEILGRDGPDPVRFGDWEKDGLISDF